LERRATTSNECPSIRQRHRTAQPLSSYPCSSSLSLSLRFSQSAQYESIHSHLPAPQRAVPVDHVRRRQRDQRPDDVVPTDVDGRRRRRWRRRGDLDHRAQGPAAGRGGATAEAAGGHGGVGGRRERKERAKREEREGQSLVRESDLRRCARFFYVYFPKKKKKPKPKERRKNPKNGDDDDDDQQQEQPPALREAPHAVEKGPRVGSPGAAGGAAKGEMS